MINIKLKKKLENIIENKEEKKEKIQIKKVIN